MSKKRVVLAGGSGFLGQHIKSVLIENGYEVCILSRYPLGEGQIYWDGQSLGDWVQFIDDSSVLINLAGRSVNCRYTEQNKADILNSRIESTSILSKAILQVPHPPEVFIQASGLGIYGNTGRQLVTEEAPAGKDFLADVCVQWENTFFSANLPRTRSVALRIGLVLAANGGILETLSRLTSFYLGGRAGDGEQVISWLHVKDLQAVILEVIEQPGYSGNYNVTSPNPVSNREFMETLRKVLKRPQALPISEFLIHLGAYFLQTEPSLILEGRRCIPQRLLENNYAFQYKELSIALGSIYK